MGSEYVPSRGEETEEESAAQTLVPTAQQPEAMPTMALLRHVEMDSRGMLLRHQALGQARIRMISIVEKERQFMPWLGI
jgi:hypothetical protein